MRILHVLDHSLPLHSGYTFRTLAIMREQRRLGWEPILLTGPKQHSGDARAEEIDGWHFYRTPEPSGSFAGLPVAGELALMRSLRGRIAELVAQLRPDIIHAHSPVLNGLPALRVARRAGLPLVYEVRAFWEDAAVEHGTSREGDARYRATRALESYVLRRADAVTTICEGLRSAIVGRGVDADRVTVIPNAVDVEHFTFGESQDLELRRELGLEHSFVLGFAGSFYRYEGLDILIRAMPLLAGSMPPIRLLLVGGGPEQARLEALVDEVGAGEMVRFTGRVPHAEVARYYGMIDLLVYPRLRHRLTELVTPLKPLEAMAQGKLVAASDVGGHRELIRPEETGFLFEPESSESIAQCVRGVLARDSDDLDNMRRAARRFVEDERTWARSVGAYQAVYPRLADCSRAAALSRESR